MPRNWRVAVASCSVPPQLSGQAVILGRLFAGIEPRSQLFLCSDPAAPLRTPSGAEIIHLRRVFRRGRFDERHLFADALPAALQIARLVRSHHVDALLGCTGGPELIAAWLASRLTRVPFHAYFFDHFRHQFRHFPRLTAALEAWIIRSARAVLVPSEGLAATLHREYGVAPVVIHQPAHDDIPEDADGSPASPEGVRIVYTGNVYEAQADSMQRLSAALQTLPETSGRPRLHVYAPQTLEAMGRSGFSPHPSSFALHPALLARETMMCQGQADILFLPLAFACPYPEIIRTAMPGKTAEYLVSGRPILVHAPADSALATYFRTHGCGVVVGDPSVEQLAAAISEIATNQPLREEMVRRARDRARCDFDPEVARARLRGALGAPEAAALSHRPSGSNIPRIRYP